MSISTLRMKLRLLLLKNKNKILKLISSINAFVHAAVIQMGMHSRRHLNWTYNRTAFNLIPAIKKKTIATTRASGSEESYIVEKKRLF